MTAPDETATPIACDLSALGPEERKRRADLAQSMRTNVREIEETPGGYRLRLTADVAAQREALEWLLLERRCCPFLASGLTFEPGEGAVWIELGGGAGAKEFLTAAGIGSIAGDAPAQDRASEREAAGQ